MSNAHSLAPAFLANNVEPIMLMFICDVKRRNVTWDGAKAEVCIDSQLTIVWAIKYERNHIQFRYTKVNRSF